MKSFFLFNKYVNLFNFFFFKKFLNYLIFFFKNINKEKIVFISDKKLSKKNRNIKYFNLIFDKVSFFKKYWIFRLFFIKKYRLFNMFDNIFFFFTKNKVILNKLNRSFLCSKIIVLSDNNMSFSNFFFNVPIIYNFNYTVNFLFYFFKFFL